jgi:hypothetical protein
VSRFSFGWHSRGDIGQEIAKQDTDGLEARELCYLCDQATETTDHILAECPFTREVWCHVSTPATRNGRDTQVVVQTQISVLRHRQHAGLDTLFALSWQAGVEGKELPRLNDHHHRLAASHQG